MLLASQANGTPRGIYSSAVAPGMLTDWWRLSIDEVFLYEICLQEEGMILERRCCLRGKWEPEEGTSWLRRKCQDFRALFQGFNPFFFFSFFFLSLEDSINLFSYCVACPHTKTAKKV